MSDNNIDARQLHNALKTALNQSLFIFSLAHSSFKDCELNTILMKAAISSTINEDGKDSISNN